MERDMVNKHPHKKCGFGAYLRNISGSADGNERRRLVEAIFGAVFCNHLDKIVSTTIYPTQTITTYMLDIVNKAVTGSFGTDVASTPGDALTREDTVPLVPQLLVLAKHECDLASTSADIARRDVRIRTNVSLKLGHERDAEATNFVVRLALGVKVGPALASTHRQPRERVLERLLEAEELEDRQAVVTRDVSVGTQK